MKTLKILAVAAVLLLASCAAGGWRLGATTPRTDDAFGQSLARTRLQQTANPRADRDADPAAGIDGKSARSAMDTLRQSFRNPAHVVDAGVPSATH